MLDGTWKWWWFGSDDFPDFNLGESFRFQPFIFHRVNHLSPARDSAAWKGQQNVGGEQVIQMMRCEHPKPIWCLHRHSYLEKHGGVALVVFVILCCSDLQINLIVALRVSFSLLPRGQLPIAELCLGKWPFRRPEFAWFLWSFGSFFYVSLMVAFISCNCCCKPRACRCQLSPA